MKTKICLFFALLFISSTLFAQGIPGKRDSIYSVILKENRIIQVVVPDGYKPGSTEKYDVLYVLDGDGITKLASNIADFLKEQSAMPPTIIVGIFNTNRDRDLLPTHHKENPRSGGADKFLSFIKSELIPYISKTYPSNGDNTLFGHSFGGVLVTYALLTEPQLFKSFIAADPSYWWDNNVMISMTAAKLPSLAGLGKTFYISGRQGQGMADMRIPQMDSLLRKAAPAGLTWKMISYPDETHGSVKLKSMYDGLKFSYAGYSSGRIVFHPMNGIMLKDKFFDLWYFTDTTKVRYTTDGTDPSLTSNGMKRANALAGPGKIIAHHFTNRSRYDQVYSAEFRTGNYLPPGKLPAKMKAGGFNYAYYEGNWDKLPDFKTLVPIKTGKTDSAFSINKLPRQNNFALLITGQLQVTEDGYHLFALDMDDGFRLYVGDQLLIDNDGVHTRKDIGQSYIIPLKKGFYPIRLEYFQKDGDKKFELEYLTPSALATIHSTPIPLALQYGKQ